MFDSIHQLLLEFIQWVRELGSAGAILYGGVYVLATVALFPGSILTLAAGFLYGPYWAMLIVLISSVTGASLAFLLARSWLRPWVSQRFSHIPSFERLERRIAAEGWKVVLLLRLSPLMPFFVMNYLLGLSTLSFRAYVAATAIGMVPGILLYTYLGSLVSTLGDLGKTSGMPTTSAQQFFFWGGLAATVAVSVILTRWAKAGLSEEEKPEGEIVG